MYLLNFFWYIKDLSLCLTRVSFVRDALEQFKCLIMDREHTTKETKTGSMLRAQSSPSKYLCSKICLISSLINNPITRDRNYLERGVVFVITRRVEIVTTGWRGGDEENARTPIRLRVELDRVKRRLKMRNLFCARDRRLLENWYRMGYIGIPLEEEVNGLARAGHLSRVSG